MRILGIDEYILRYKKPGPLIGPYPIRAHNVTGDLNPETKRLTSLPVTGRQFKTLEGAEVLRYSRSTAEYDAKEVSV
ncbi:hypothetical protein J6590_064273 [Homalodisca vitripennis]|nr:hypothetical protein J6590_064273 [Homalodisca vitripennis]